MRSDRMCKSVLRLAPVVVLAAASASQLNAEDGLARGDVPAPANRDIVFSGADRPSVGSFDLSGAISGSTSRELAGAYRVIITGDQASVPKGYIDAFQVIDRVGGGRFSGTRDALHSVIGFDATPSPSAMVADATTRDLVSNLAEGYADHPWGGAAGVGNARGNLTGYNANVRLTAGAPFWNVLTGQEIDVSAGGALGLFRKYGILNVEGGDDGTNATGEEAWQAFAAGKGAAGFDNLILLGSRFGDQSSPISARGSILSAAVQNGAPVVTASFGIDLRNVLFAAGGLAYASPGFSVDPRGRVSTSALSAAQIRGAGGGLAALLPHTGSGDIGGAFYAGPAFPTIDIEEPKQGTTARVVVSAMGWTGGGRFVTAGAGCTVGDILTPRDVAGTPYQARVTAVDGSGGVVGIAPTGLGAGRLTAPTPGDAQALAGGTCSREPVYRALMYIPSDGYVWLDRGSGYAFPPTVALSPSPVGDDPRPRATLASDAPLTIAAPLRLSKHELAAGPAPRLTACGATSTISGSDTAGLIAKSDGAGSCRLVFAQPFEKRPYCTVTGEGGAVRYTVTPVDITMSVGGPTNIDYHCVGQADG